MKAKIRLFILSFSLLFVLFAYQYIIFNDGKLHIVFCNVGQGDAVYIRTPKGADILIDAGPDGKVSSCLASHLPFYDRDLEAVFMTHPDSDHMNGFIDIVKQYKIKYFYTSRIQGDTDTYKELERLLKERNIPITYTYKGDNVKVSDTVNIRTISPEKKDIHTKSANKNIYSLIQVLSYGTFDLLLTGDNEAEKINTIVSGLKDIEVLKLPHHGAKTGVNINTFTQFHPQLVVISVGKNNRYGHPASNIIQLLKDYDIPYKRTDLDGEVEIVSTGKGYDIR